MNSRIIGGIAALVLAVVGAVLLIIYVGAADRRAQDGLQPQEVLVAAADVPSGTAAEDLPDYLERPTLPAAAVADGALSDLGEHAGTVLSQPLLEGEQLLAQKLVDPATQLEPGTYPVPQGLQEVTVVLEPARVVGGKLRAGDRVAVFGNYDKDDAVPHPNFTKLLMEQVLVTGIQIALPDQEVQTDDGVAALPTGSAFVTFAVDADQAGRIVFTQDFGQTWLTKQNEDTADAERDYWDIKEILK
ncbi:hypothetical protein BJH93_09555 [Kocuria polaris]|nr:hypothetical protein [Kocuria polaris]